MRIKIFIANKIHDVKRGEGGLALSVTMTLIFPKIVWTCPLSRNSSLVISLGILMHFDFKTKYVEFG